MYLNQTKPPRVGLFLNVRPNKNGLYTIFVRITKNYQMRRRKTSVEVRRQDFNRNAKPGHWVRPSDIDHMRKNDALAREIARVVQTARGMDAGATVGEIARALDAAPSQRESLFLAIGGQAYEGFAAERTQETERQFESYKKRVGFLNKLAGYMRTAGMRELHFQDLTPQFLHGFHSYLQDQDNSRERGRKLHPNTIAKALALFRTLVRQAEGERLITHEDNPFNGFKITTTEPLKEHLNGNELAAMEALYLRRGSMEWHARNLWLFSFYCAGIRVGDLLQLRWSNVAGGVLSYQMGKNHKSRQFEMVAAAVEILDLYRPHRCTPSAYVFPFLDSGGEYAPAVTVADRDTLPLPIQRQLKGKIGSSTAQLNRALKSVAAKAGIAKPLTMHIARHTFAALAQERHLPPRVVQMMLAHSNLSTTEHYMGSLAQGAVSDGLKKMFPDE